MKANRKRLKIILALGVKNFGLFSIALKLVEFPVFDNFFLDLAKFQDLNVFSLFDFFNLNNFPNFLVCSTLFLPIPNLLTSPLLLFLPKAGMLSLFLLELNLLPLFLLVASLSYDPIVFSIEVSGAIILLKL